MMDEEFYLKWLKIIKMGYLLGICKVILVEKILEVFSLNFVYGCLGYVSWI